MNLDNINIELTGNPSDYKYPMSTVYTAEFDYDFKILVCHTYNEPVLKAFTDFMYNTVSRPIAGNSIKRAIEGSSVITLDIVYIQKPKDVLSNTRMRYSDTFMRNMLIIRKFDFIYNLKSYDPYGLNSLNYIVEYGEFKERACARKLIKALNKENPKPCMKGPKPGPIYKYDPVTGEQRGAFGSISEAAKDADVLVSSIYQCLSGRSHTAGNYVWSRVNTAKLDTNGLKKRKAFEATIEDRRRQFIEGRGLDYEQLLKQSNDTN